MSSPIALLALILEYIGEVIFSSSSSCFFFSSYFITSNAFRIALTHKIIHRHTSPSQQYLNMPPSTTSSAGELRMFVDVLVVLIAMLYALLHVLVISWTAADSPDSAPSRGQSQSGAYHIQRFLATPKRGDPYVAGHRGPKNATALLRELDVILSGVRDGSSRL